MDYYAALELPRTATDAEIKKAYRRLAHKYHPDKNPGDKSAEERFKQVAEAYSVLGDPNKKTEYDAPKRQQHQNFGGFGFNDFVNHFSSQGFRDGGRARTRQNQARQDPPSTEYLNITLVRQLSFKDLVTGTKLELQYTRKKIEYASGGPELRYRKIDENKEITINLDLRKLYLPIKKEGSRYHTKVRVGGMGHEDLRSRVDVWGDSFSTPLTGDLYVEIDLVHRPEIELEENNIVHRIEVPLYKVLAKDEKILVESIFGKRYEAEVNRPKYLGDLQFVLKGEGFLNKAGEMGDYIIRFDILTPDLAVLKKEEKSQLLSLLREI